MNRMHVRIPVVLAFLGVLVGVYHTRVKYPDTGRKKTRRPQSEPPGERLATIIKEVDRQ